MKSTLIFVLAVLGTIVWIASLFVRRRNAKAGAAMSWIALAFMTAAVVLYHIWKES